MIYTVANTLKAGKDADVFVNGNLIPGAYYADTEKGIVKYYPRPFRVKKNADYVYSRVAKGNVTVKLKELQ